MHWAVITMRCTLHALSVFADTCYFFIIFNDTTVSCELQHKIAELLFYFRCIVHLCPARGKEKPYAFRIHAKNIRLPLFCIFVSAFSFCLCLISGQLFPECLLSTPTASRSTPAARRTATGHQSCPVCGSLPPEGGVLSFGGGVDSFLSSIFGEAFTL